jgi:hypothetical protein
MGKQEANSLIFYFFLAGVLWRKVTIAAKLCDVGARGIDLGYAA